MAHTACLVCFISTVNGHNKKKEKKKKPIMSCASSGQITNLKQSIFVPFYIYGFIALVTSYQKFVVEDDLGGTLLVAVDVGDELLQGDVEFFDLTSLASILFNFFYMSLALV
jgi:hypothetical protein